LELQRNSESTEPLLENDFRLPNSRAIIRPVLKFRRFDHRVVKGYWKNRFQNSKKERGASSWQVPNDDISPQWDEN